MKFIKIIFIIFLSYFFINTSYAYDENIVPVANPSGYGYGYNNVFEGKGAFEREFSFENGEKVKGYSLDFNEPVNMNSDNFFAVIPYKDTGYTSIKQIGFLARSFDNLGEPLKDPKSESVARQVAVWSLGGSFELIKLRELNYPIMKRAEELIILSKGKEYNNLGIVYNVSADITDKKSVTIKFKNNYQPISNLAVTITKNNQDKSVLKSNTLGEISFDLDQNYKENNINFGFSANIPAGSVLFGNNGGMVITTNETLINVSDNFSFKIADNNKKIIKKNIPIKKIIKSYEAIEVKDKDIKSIIESGNFKIVDSSSSSTFEKKHIVDSINYFVGSNIPIENIDKNSKILIIGENKEDTVNVKDYLIIEKFTYVYFYLGNYENIYKVINDSFIIEGSDITDDPSNTVIVFDEDTIESGSDKERSNPVMLLLGVLLLIISIIASFIRIRSSKK